ncbi:MAG: histidine phosphatase family protein [Eubacteriales bacterium]|nr:histidine phosphatase family protein [Eubacteriales bacterium]
MMDIVFLRHGKAEGRQENLCDKQRKLVQEGRQKTLKTAEKLKKRILHSPITIISSPAIRALQTALILKETLQTQNFNVVDAVYTGDTVALKQEIENLESYGTCIIVGHEPLLSDWLREIFGLHSHIKKSGYVTVRKTEDNKYHIVEVRRAVILPHMQE